METPVPVGQLYAVTASGSKLLKTSADNRLANAEDYQVSFQGRAEVIEVDRSGQPFKVAFTVKSLSKTANGETVDLVKPGTIILADGSLERPFSLKDGPVDQAVQDAFAVVYSAHKPNDVSDDDVFGSRTPRRIGESWPIDAAKGMKSLAENGLIIAEGHLNGTTSLVGKGKVGSSDCLNLRGEIKADGVSSKDFPPDVKVDEGSVQAVIHGCFPMAEAALSYSGGAELSLLIRLVTADGVKLQVTSAQKMDETWIAIAK
jgi:hypothetical protein